MLICLINISHRHLLSSIPILQPISHIWSGVAKLGLQFWIRWDHGAHWEHWRQWWEWQWQPTKQVWRLCSQSLYLNCPEEIFVDRAYFSTNLIAMTSSKFHSNIFSLIIFVVMSQSWSKGKPIIKCLLFNLKLMQRWHKKQDDKNIWNKRSLLCCCDWRICIRVDASSLLELLNQD